MRIAIVHPAPLPADASHRDLVPTERGLRELGHDVTLYATAAQAEISDVPLELAGERLAEPAYWSAQDIEAAIVLSWLGRPRVISAPKAVGAVVVSKVTPTAWSRSGTIPSNSGGA
jgi:hypothetical protein